MTEVRCRIAPSPSGFLHIGTAKIALFNWLFARKMDGSFVLRLEDTDADRTDETFVEAMCEGFSWLGIDWDEGPSFGGVPEKGELGPYRQSQRKELHQRDAQRLLDEGKAYKCFLTPDELDAERNKARAEKRPLRTRWRDASAGEVDAMTDARHVVRFKVPDGETTVHDLVQGDVTVNHRELDDFVILKPNGDPIFHLAVVVDDALMKISHVIRGDDHLANAPRHILLFEALGYPLPQFAHLPMVLDERGKKYSKREHGANVLDWRDDGYLPEGLINYVALLGWTPEEDGRELFNRDELLEAFTPERWGKSAARFDLKKVQWLNGQHIRTLPTEELRDRLVPILEREGFDTFAKSSEWLAQLAEICQEKIPTLNDIVQQCDYFFRDITDYQEKTVKKHWKKDGARERMKSIREALAQVSGWTHDGIKQAIEALAENSGESFGKFVHPMRLALTGKSVGPGLFELAELLGQPSALARIDQGIAFIETLEESTP